MNARAARRAAERLSVNKLNVKIRKAKDFAARRRSYVRTFGEGHVEFIPIAAVENIAGAEKVVKAALAQWRVRHTSGRLHEWLREIAAIDVEIRMIDALERAGIAFERVGSVSPRTAASG